MKEIFDQTFQILDSSGLLSFVTISFSLVLFLRVISLLGRIIYDQPVSSGLFDWLAEKLKILAIKCFGMERLVAWGFADSFVDYVDCDYVDCESCPFCEYCDSYDECPAEPVK